MPPPPPPPPGAPPPPPVAAMPPPKLNKNDEKARSQLLGSIQQGAKLKKVPESQKKDKSAPLVPKSGESTGGGGGVPSFGGGGGGGNGAPQTMQLGKGKLRAPAGLDALFGGGGSGDVVPNWKKPANKPTNNQSTPAETNTPLKPPSFNPPTQKPQSNFGAQRSTPSPVQRPPSEPPVQPKHSFNRSPGLDPSSRPTYQQDSTDMHRTTTPLPPSAPPKPSVHAVPPPLQPRPVSGSRQFPTPTSQTPPPPRSRPPSADRPPPALPSNHPRTVRPARPPPPPKNPPVAAFGGSMNQQPPSLQQRNAPVIPSPHVNQQNGTGGVQSHPTGRGRVPPPPPTTPAPPLANSGHNSPSPQQHNGGSPPVPPLPPNFNRMNNIPPQSIDNSSRVSSDEFERRFTWIDDFPPPPPFRDFKKSYPSKSAKSKAPSQRPAIPPPAAPVH